MVLKVVLFDLDGTLVDVRDAAWQLFEETNREFGLGVDSQDKFLQLSETNIFVGLASLCEDDAKAQAVAEHFMDLVRRRYNPPFIPGMVEVVREFAACSTLAILSSNMLDTIRRILASGCITDFFPHILAGDDEPSKTIAIKRFLKLGVDARTAALDVASPVSWSDSEVAMVTDTVGDVGEGLAAGIRVCGVSWGMHSEQQLRAAGAEYVARTPQELLEWFRQTSAVVH